MPLEFQSQPVCKMPGLATTCELTFLLEFVTTIIARTEWCPLLGPETLVLLQGCCYDKLVAEPRQRC